MANRIDTSCAARMHLLLNAFKHFDENPPSPEVCKLRDGANLFVPGEGSFNPRAILIGEAPGAREDITGQPFVGRSGKFLDELLQEALLRPEDVWITNVVKYRPPENRTPDSVEVDAFLPLLRRELAFVAGGQCKLVVGLGRTACSAMAGQPISVARAHGSVRSLKAGWELFVSYHPSAGLRNNNVHEQMVYDFRKLRWIVSRGE